MAEALTIQQIRARYNKEKPKFIGLKNEAGQWVVPRNTPKIKPDKRMQEMEAFFKKDSTPDGMYFYVTKESLNTNSPETVTPVAKGNVTSVQIREAPQTIQTVKTESVWDVKTAVDKLSEINRLSFENAWLRKENEELRKMVDELKANATLAPEEKENDLKGTLESMKGLAEVFLPSLDKHFELRERELNIKERMARNSSVAPARTRTLRSNGAGRTDGGLPVTDANYEAYFANVMEKGTDEQVDNECAYLEEVNPALYAQFKVKYEIDDEEEAPQNGEQAN